MSGRANAVRRKRRDDERSRPGRDRRAERREATRREIRAAAWELVREHGLAALSMRSLGESVGMRAQSLYGYVDSKEALLDELFRDGYEDFADWMRPVLEDGPTSDVVLLATEVSHRFFEFCVQDPARYQLLFQRTVPGFEPSPDSYALARHALDELTAAMERAGITDPDAPDLWTAVLTGLTSQQISNDPGGRRWARLVDRAVHMLLVELAPEVDVGAPARTTGGPAGTDGPTSTTSTTSTKQEAP